MFRFICTRCKRKKRERNYVCTRAEAKDRVVLKKETKEEEIQFEQNMVIKSSENEKKKETPIITTKQASKEGERK